MTSPAVETQTPVRRNAEQDQEISNAIIRALQLIDTVRSTPPLSASLGDRGYDAAKLQEGADLQGAALEAFNRRQAAMAAQRRASADLDGLDAAARTFYADFREVARALFKDAADRTALVLRGNVPGDRQRFITTAQGSYNAALTERYQADLATFGEFTAEVLNTAIEALGALAHADETQNVVIGQAVKATADRDESFAQLEQWVKQFNHVAKVALKGQPDLAKALEVAR